MAFYVYILFSAIADKYYVGQTENLEQRLFQHNNSKSRYTKFVHDWKLVYSECFSSRGEAVKRETLIKNKKSRKYIEFIVASIG